MAELWALLIQAQENPTGIPDSLLDVKKEELAKKRVSKFWLCTTVWFVRCWFRRRKKKNGNGNGSEKRRRTRTRTGNKRRGRGRILRGVQDLGRGLVAGRRNARKTIGIAGKTNGPLGADPNRRIVADRKSTKPATATAVRMLKERRIVLIKMLKVTRWKKIILSPTANGKKIQFYGTPFQLQYDIQWSILI